MDRLIKLTFIGDIMCQREQIAAIQRCRTRYDVIFDQVKHLWVDSDYVVGNLETPVAGKRLRYAYEQMRFNAPDEFAAAIKRAGVNFVSLANNHILDRGVEGLEYTINMLDAIGLEHSGAYTAKEDSDDLFIKEISGVRFAFVACTYGVNQGLKCNYLPDDELWRVDILKYPHQQITTRIFLVKRFLSNLIPLPLKQFFLRRKASAICKEVDAVEEEAFCLAKHAPYLNRILNKIREAKTQADIVIAFPHIGGQYCDKPGPWQLKVTDALIRAGADIVVANHAHVPLAVEERNGALVAHCLGNFCFSPNAATWRIKDADCSLLFNCYFDAATRRFVRYDGRILRTLFRGDGVAIPVPTQRQFS